MTTALATLLMCIAGAALILAGVTYFWVNRTPSGAQRFDEYGRVPLFGVDVGAPREAIFATAPPAVPPLVHTNNSGPVAVVAATETASSASVNVTSVTPEKRAGGEGWGTRPGWPIESFPTPPKNPAVEHYKSPAPFPRITPISSPLFPNIDGNGSGISHSGVPGSMVEGHNLRFSVPAEGTLQFLPGRLEISSGLDAGREIRFVRVPGPNGTEVTFGRNEGPLYRHIQLRDQTVSREHARMTLAEGRWYLTNLSRTNPVAHNGRVLGYGEQQPLEDGDRVEMGEVVFSFRSR